MIAKGFTERVCARCGKGMSQGKAPAAWSLLVQEAKDWGVELRAPSSSYLDPQCANEVRAQLAKLPTAKPRLSR
jgi:hypothetical protein